MKSKNYKYYMSTYDQGLPSNRPDLSRIVEENEEDAEFLNIFSVEFGHDGRSPLVVIINADVIDRILGMKLGGIRIKANHPHWQNGLVFYPVSWGWIAKSAGKDDEQNLGGYRIYLFKMSDSKEIFRDIDALVEKLKEDVKVKVNWHMVEELAAAPPKAKQATPIVAVASEPVSPSPIYRDPPPEKKA